MLEVIRWAAAASRRSVGAGIMERRFAGAPSAGRAAAAVRRRAAGRPGAARGPAVRRLCAVVLGGGTRRPRCSPSLARAPGPLDRPRYVISFRLRGPQHEYRRFCRVCGTLLQRRELRRVMLHAVPSVLARTRSWWPSLNNTGTGTSARRSDDASGQQGLDGSPPAGWPSGPPRRDFPGERTSPSRPP
jgi:hypothetical protein